MFVRHTIAAAIILALGACGGSDGGPSAVPGGGDAASSVAAQPPSSEAPRSAGLDTEIVLPPEIEQAWSGIRVRVVRVHDQTSEDFEVAIDGSVLLGDSGLMLTAFAFVPDFVMDENGITSRSPNTTNPAARVLISDGGSFEYEGWLFVAMPGLHSHPHPMYQVQLVEGIPAG